MLREVIGAQLGEVNSTDYHGWKDCGIGLYRKIVNESTWDVGRRP